MKKISIALAGIAALAALPAFSGVNPNDPGLPQAWTTTGGRYSTNFVVGSATVAGDRLTQDNSFASAICVECHGRNPSALVTAPTAGGSYSITNGAVNRGSHYVADDEGDTHTGGGFAAGTLSDRRTNATHPVTNFTGAGTTITQPRTAGQYEKLTAWQPGAQAGKGLSKYGVAGAQTRNSATGAAGDIVCESCHNLVVNAGNQLLLGTYGHTNAAGNDNICRGCHAAGVQDAAGVVPPYSYFHDNGNLAPFFNPSPGGNPAGQKRHHVSTADTLNMAATGPYNPDSNANTNDGVNWSPSYTRELGGSLVAANAAYAFGKGLSVTGQGALAGPLAAGDIGTGTTIACQSCHRPHNALTKSGAYIFRTGTGTDITSSPSATGLERQFDTAGGKVYGEYLVLCNGCHTGYN